jgi:hypothetical protein
MVMTQPYFEILEALSTEVERADMLLRLEVLGLLLPVVPEESSAGWWMVEWSCIVTLKQVKSGGGSSGPKYALKC